MCFDSHVRRRRRRRVGAVLRMALLIAPALFWTAVFAALAGLRPEGLSIESVPDAAQILLAAACMIAAVIIGYGPLRVEGRTAHGSVQSASAPHRAKGSERFRFKAD